MPAVASHMTGTRPGHLALERIPYRAASWAAEIGGHPDAETPTFHFQRSRYGLLRHRRSGVRNVFRARLGIAGHITRHADAQRQI